MNKGFSATLATILFVVAGYVGVRWWQMHVINSAVDEVTTTLGATAERNRQQVEAQRQERKSLEDEANTVCAINNDANTCICRDLRTGRQVPHSFEECQARTK